MAADESPNPQNEEFWRDFLTNGDSRDRKLRGIYRRIPHEPRCKVCAAPFSGVGGPLMRMIGKRPSQQSPKMCGSCFDFLAEHHGGAEIEVTLLFADVRGSTALAEGMPAAQFRDVMNRFYSTASKIVFDHDGSVDKFVGDELVAMFFPLLTGERHAAEPWRPPRRSCAPRATRMRADPGCPWARASTPARPGLDRWAKVPGPR